MNEPITHWSDDVDGALTPEAEAALDAELAATVPALDGESLVVHPFGPGAESGSGPATPSAEDLTMIEDTEELIARAQEALGRAQADRADAAAITAALDQLRKAADFSQPA